MKNNKLFSLILCFTFVFTSLLSCFPVYEAKASTIELYDEDYENAYSVLCKICPAFPLPQGESITRADFVAAVTMLLGCGESTGVETGFSDVSKDHKYSGNIKFAKDFGLISSAETFSPDVPVTYVQAIKILMCATGHGKKAEYLGGYPTGYLAVATETSVGASNKHLSSEATLTHKEATELIFDAVCTDILDATSFGDSFGYAEIEGKNILSVFHKIYMAEGVVDANKSTGLYSASAGLDYEGFTINGNEYHGEGYNSLLGKRARVFFKNDNKRDVIYAYPVANKVYSFTHEDDLELSDSKLNVFVNNSAKDQDYSLEDDYAVIYNGKYYAAAENTYNTCLNPDAGKVEIIDNDNNKKIDVIIIKNIEYGVVGNVNVFEEKIYDRFKTNGMKSLSDDIDYYIVGSDGEPLELADLQKNDVVGYAESKDGKSLEITRYTGKIGGTYTELSNNIINLGKDKNVELSRYFTDNIKSLSDIKLGAQIIAYLGIGNQVVFMEEYSTALNYGFLVAYGEDKTSLDGGPRVKIYGQDGEMYEMDLADKIVYNGIRVSADIAKDYLRALELQPNIMKVIKFGVNANGELSKLYETVANTEGASALLTTVNTEASPVLFDDNTAHGSTSNLNKLYYTGNIFFPYFAPASGAVIMQVPETEEFKDDIEYYNIYTASTLNSWTDSNAKNIKCYGYDVTSSGASFLLWTLDGAGSSSVGDSTPTGVVESITTGADDDGNIVKVVTVYISNSWKKLYTPSKYTDDQAAFKSQIDNLQPGDMVRLAYDNENNITALQIDFSYVNGKTVYSSTDTGVSGYGGRYVGYAAGYAYAIENNKATIIKNKTIEQIQNETVAGTLGIDTIYPVNLSSGTTVYVELNRDRQTNEIISADVYKEANVSNVESYFTAGLDADYIVSRSRFHAINLNVVYVN